MDYLDYLNRHELINERARCSSELNQLKVKKEEDDQSVKQNMEKIKNDLNAILEKCDERLKAQKEEKDALNNGGPGQNGGAQEQSLIPLSGDVMVQSMQKTAKMSSCKFFFLLNEIVLETKAHKSFVIETLLEDKNVASHAFFLLHNCLPQR